MSENNHIPSCLTLAVVSRGAKWLKRGREGGRVRRGDREVLQKTDKELQLIGSMGALKPLSSLLSVSCLLEKASTWARHFSCWTGTNCPSAT